MRVLFVQMSGCIITKMFSNKIPRSSYAEMIKNFTKIKVTALKIRQKFDLIYFNQIERKFKGATYIRPKIIDDELSFWIRKLCIDSSLLNFLEITPPFSQKFERNFVPIV